MSHADDQSPDEITGRTALATEALHGVHGLQMDLRGVKRTVRRVSWVWGASLLVAAIFGSGFAFHEWATHYATKVLVGENTARIEMLEKWREQKDEHERSRDEMLIRMSHQIDTLYEERRRK
jgi:hypothetical protein